MTSQWIEYGSFYGCPNYENELRIAIFGNSQYPAQMFPLNAWFIVNLAQGNNPIPLQARAVELRGILVETGSEIDENTDIRVAVRKPGSNMDPGNYQLQTTLFLKHDGKRDPMAVMCPLLNGCIEVYVGITGYQPGQWPAHASEAVNLHVAGFWGPPGLAL